MPLDIDLKPTFSEEATAHPPGGKPQIFVATFEALDVPTLDSFDLSTPAGSRVFLERALIGADDVLDGKGNKVPYTTVLRDRMLDKQWVRKALIEAYFTGFNKAAEKN